MMVTWLGTGATRALPNQGRYDWDPAWSPDGKSLAYRHGDAIVVVEVGDRPWRRVPPLVQIYPRTKAKQ